MNWAWTFALLDGAERLRRVGGVRLDVQNFQRVLVEPEDLRHIVDLDLDGLRLVRLSYGFYWIYAIYGEDVMFIYGCYQMIL